MRYLPLLLLLPLLAPNSSALGLTIDDALQMALRNNQRIVQFQAGQEEARAGVGSAGAAFYPRIDLDYNYNKGDQDPFFQGTEFSTLTLSASYNLFNGLADLRSLQAAKARSNAAAYQLQAIIADTALAVKQAYIEQLRTQHSVTTADKGVELLQRQHHDAKLRFDQGMIARNDLLRIEVEMSNARQDLLQAEGALQVARHQLERVLGVPLPEGRLEDFTRLPDPLENGADSYRQELLKQRSEIRYLEDLLHAATLERSAQKGDYLPRIDLIYAREYYGDSLSPNGRSKSYDEDTRLTLNASWNLFNGFATRKAVTAATAKTRGLAAELKDTQAALILQLQTALEEARMARGRLQQARTGVTQAEENYRVTESRYRQRQSTSVDLLDAQFLLTRARNQEVDARYDLHLSAAVLDRVLERGVTP